MNENITKGLLLSLSTLAIASFFFTSSTRKNPEKKKKTWIQMFDGDTKEPIEDRAFTTLEFIENNSDDGEVDETVLEALNTLKKDPTTSVSFFAGFGGSGSFIIREAILDVAKLNQKKERVGISTKMRVSEFFDMYGDLEKEIKDVLKGAEGLKIKKEDGDVVFVSLVKDFDF